MADPPAEPAPDGKQNLTRRERAVEVREESPSPVNGRPRVDALFVSDLKLHTDVENGAVRHKLPKLGA